MDISIPYWKKVWKTIASNTSKVPKNVISGLLNEVGDDLCKGIKVYATPFNESECKCWLEKSDLKEIDHAFEKFFFRLCKSLNLQGESAWSILCNYLLYEFHGKLSRIKLLATYEPFATKLIEAIWHFYTAERTYLLKTLRFILENYNNSQYTEIFSDYMKKVTWKFLWENVVGQLEYLITEINNSTVNNTIDATAWLERNGQEQLEVALIAIAGIGFSNFTVNDFIPLLMVFMKNDFGRVSSIAPLNTQVFDILCCAEIGAFLAFLENCWTNEDFWLEQKDELDRMISLAANCRGYDLIIFSWAILQAELCLEDGAEYIARYSKKFDTLLASNIMLQLYEFTSNTKNIKGKPRKTILKAIYSLMNHLCNAFNDSGFISLHPNTCDVMYELLKEQELCAIFQMDTGKPIYHLLEFSLKFFPLDFKGVTLFMLAFTESGCNDRVVNALNNLCIYAEDYTGRLKDESNIFLRTDYFPIPNSQHICIPKGTAAVVFAKFRKTLLLYQTNYNYFAVILSLLDSLTVEIAENNSLKQETFEKLLLGYKLIAAILQNELLDIGTIKHFLRHSIRVYHLFHQGQFRNLAMMNVFLQAVEGAMFSKIREEDKFWASDFLPRINSTVTENILKHYDVFTPSVLLDLIELEEQDQSHVLLRTYIQFIKKAFERRTLHKEVQLPGIVYLITHVFSKHKDYKYNNIMDCYDITNMILEIVWNIIKQDEKNMANEEERFLYNFCLEAFLTNNYVLKGYYELFKVTLFIAQKFLERETSWEIKNDVTINKYITLTLQTFLMLIKHNRHKKNKKVYCSSLFEQVILHAPLDRLNTVKIVTAFVDYAFDKEVQKLALAILKNMAQDSSYPMFGPMDLEPFQLQSFFLDKLRDPVEADEIKMSIIDFVLTCVEHQPGLTNAFFNINVLNTEEGEDEGESVVSCMMDFLENIEESKITIHHPLLRGVLAVIHKVWDVGSMHLMQKITELKNFWPTLVKPLYHNLVGDSKFYGCIFGILAHEFLYSKNNLSEEFSNVIRELLDVKKDFMKKWSVYLINISSTIMASSSTDQFDDVSYTGDIFVLYTWKLFISYGQMFAVEFFTDPNLRTIITDTCLDALLAHFDVMAQLPCIKFWSELYALCMSEWSADSFNAIPELFSKTRQVLSALIIDYGVINPSSKQAILTATAILMKKFTSYANSNPEIIHDILEPLGHIVQYEFNQLVDDLSRENNDVPNSLPNWLLTLSVVNKILLLKNVSKHAYWFEESGFLKKVLWCVGPFVQSPKTLPFAKFVMKSLIIYSQSPFANDLLRIDKSSFFKETVPPTEYVHPPLKNILIMREWWITYAELIKLINFLILKFCYALTTDVLAFIHFHDDTLIACLELARLTADPAALNLICCVLMLCNNMLLWRGRWIANKENYFARTVNSIKNCISGVCNLVLRPKSLAFVTVHDLASFVENDKISEDMYLDIYNMVLEAITLGIRFFVKCHPPLLSYLDYPEHRYVVLELEKDFYIPKYNLSELNVFTYGGILCILQFLCKAYMKISDNLRKKSNNEEGKMLSRRTLKAVPSIEAIITRDETFDTPTKKIDPYLAIILAQADMDLAYDPISSVQRLATTCFNLFDMPWFLKINIETLQLTLETLSYFVVLELSSDLRSPNISCQMKEYIKREMGSEMQFFNDFVRRTMQEHLESTKVENTSPRKRMELEKLSIYMKRLLKEKDVECHDEFFWVLNHLVQDSCQTEDDN